MSIAALFGDDEHTSEAGPYKRLLTTRKWLVLFAAAGVALDNGMLRLGEINKFIRFVTLPDWGLHGIVFASLTYALAIYVFLLFQALRILTLIYRERFQVRKQEDLAMAREAVEMARSSYEAAVTGAANANSKRPELMGDLGQRQVQWAKQNLEQQEQRLGQAQSNDPSSSRIYRALEIGIDAVRVLPALLFALWAWMHMIF